MNGKAKRERLTHSRRAEGLPAVATRSAGSTEPACHRDLDHLAGVWSQAEYDEFMQALREQRRIDPEMWK